MLPAAALALLRPLLARAAVSAMGEAAIGAAARTGATRAAAAHAARQGATAEVAAAAESAPLPNPFNWGKSAPKITINDLPNPFNWSTGPSPQRREIGKFDEPRPTMNPFGWAREATSPTPPPNPYGWENRAVAPAGKPSFGESVRNFAGDMASRFKQSSLYSNVADARAAIRTIREGAAPPSPDGASYKNLSPSDLVGMAGRSPEQIGAADAAAKEEQLAQAQEKLFESTKRLADGFKTLLTGGVKGIVSTIAASAALTKVNGAYIDWQVSQYGGVNSAFASMGAQRQFQDIQLNQRTAAATSGSASVLNRLQMRGKDEWNKLTTDTRSVMNIASTVSQVFGTAVAYQFNQVMEGIGLRSFIRKAEAELGKKNGELPESTMQIAIQLGLLAQQARGDEKRNAPLRGVR